MRVIGPVPLHRRAAGYDTAFAGEWSLSRVPRDAGTGALQAFGFDEWLTSDVRAGDTSADGVAAVVARAQAWLAARAQGGSNTRPVFLCVVLGTCTWQPPAWRHPRDGVATLSRASGEEEPATRCQQEWRALCGRLFQPSVIDGDGQVLQWHDDDDADALQAAVDVGLRSLQAALPSNALVRAG